MGFQKKEDKMIQNIKYDRATADAAELAFIKNPSVKNRNELIVHHGGLVNKSVNYYLKFLNQSFQDDLFQEGMIGLISAANKFEPEKKVKFATYGAFWITASLGKFVCNTRGVDLLMPKVYFRLRAQDEQAISIRKQYPNYSKPFLSWHMPISGDNDYTLEEVTSSSDPNIEEVLISADQIAKAVSAAAPVLAKHPVRSLIFYDRLFTDSPQTLKEIGDKVNLSREGVRLHEKHILKYLKQVH